MAIVQLHEELHKTLQDDSKELHRRRLLLSLLCEQSHTGKDNNARAHHNRLDVSRELALARQLHLAANVAALQSLLVRSYAANGAH